MIAKFDGISVKLQAIGDGEVTLEVSLSKDKQPMVYWPVEHLKQGDSWKLSGCDITLPYELTK